MLELLTHKTGKGLKKYYLWLLCLALLVGVFWAVYLLTGEPKTKVYSDFKPMNAFEGFATGGIKQPTGVAVGPKKQLYIIDSGNKRITVLHPDGRYAFSFGGPGSGRAQLDKPVSIDVGGDGRVYVVDKTKASVLVFESDGTYLNTIAKRPSGSFQPSSKASTYRSDVYGSKWVKNPLGITYLPSKQLTLVSDSYDNRIVVFSERGKYLGEFGGTGSGINQFLFPAGMAWDGQGRLYVADQYNNRIVVYGE